MILYDITRLILRLKRYQPSGIDRVDLEYLKFLIKKKDVLFIFCKSGFIYPVNRNMVNGILELLSDKWFNGNKFLNFERAKLLLKLYVLRLSFFCRTILNLSPNQYGHNIKIRDLSEEVIYINTSHINLEYLNYFKNFFNGNFFSVTLLHDIIPISQSNLVRNKNTKIDQIRIQNAIQYSDLLLTTSDYNVAEINSISANKINVGKIKLGVNCFDKHEIGKPTSYTHNYKSNYYIMVGTLELRKNHIFALKLWEKVIQNYESPPLLYIIGRRGNGYKLFKKEYDSLNKKGKKYIKLIHNCSDFELLSYYRNAKALIHVSKAEGWGMTISEALTQRLPVLCNSICPFNEQASGFLTHPSDTSIDAWEALIAKVNAIDDIFEFYNIDIESFEAYSWENHFSQFAELMLQKGVIIKDLKDA